MQSPALVILFFPVQTDLRRVTWHTCVSPKPVACNNKFTRHTQTDGHGQPKGPERERERERENLVNWEPKNVQEGIIRQLVTIALALPSFRILSLAQMAHLPTFACFSEAHFFSSFLYSRYNWHKHTYTSYFHLQLKFQQPKSTFFHCRQIRVCLFKFGPASERLHSFCYFFSSVLPLSLSLTQCHFECTIDGQQFNLSRLDLNWRDKDTHSQGQVEEGKRPSQVWKTSWAICFRWLLLMRREWLRWGGEMKHIRDKRQRQGPKKTAQVYKDKVGPLEKEKSRRNKCNKEGPHKRLSAK